MDFSGLRPVLNKRAKVVISLIPLVRDNLDLTTWICIGAVVQSVAFLVVGRLALLPATGLLVYRVLEAYAITTGLIHNPYMQGVISEKVSAQFPDSSGSYGNKASNSDVAVLLIGTQSNHPLGILAPGFKELSTHFAGMTNELEDNAVEHGFLGHSSYLSTQRATNNALLSVMYFKSADHVHRFAEGPSHRVAWSWWSKIHAAHPHLMIFHELYQVPKGYWETVYQHAAPLNAAATSHRAVRNEGEGEGEGEKEVWMSPVVDARKGVLKSSSGRMGRDLSSEG